MNTQNNHHEHRRLSSLQKALIFVVALFFLCIPFFWYLEFHLGVPQSIASNIMVVFCILLFAIALLLPWLKLSGQKMDTTLQRLDKMVIIWIFICLSPRLIWELPWLFFLDEIRSGVTEGALWSYFWSPYLLGGDARYFNGDPLVVTLEGIAIFVGIFEGWALWRFFAQGKKFTNIQLSLIMAGMIVEVLLPAVYFGSAVVGQTATSTSTADLWIKFIFLNSFWCTMPLVTYFWGVHRLANQDLAITF